MKTLKNILAVAILALAIVACKNETQPEVKTVQTETKAKKEVKELDPNATYAKAEFNIKGMTCEIGCAKTIEKKLAKMEGVKSAKVDFGKELAMVEYDNAKVTTQDLEETVTKAADIYKVENMNTVEAFSNKKECAPKCSEDCTKENCDKCAAKKAECKKKCDAKKAEGKSCGDDCTKACCAEKKGKA
ncbi:heavy-metal-associated domain-containing protein [Pontimicrobium sp. IMCC45349]|uniref:heavy-metal-associated domain-containing protein n=1 Tax=Pontimicrobium sp. IMCC45349 TaxID=3391574 RepID=UPI00399F3A92